jgi:hypothetical protein
MFRRILVMISSTIDDLSTERDAVEGALKEFQFERFRSEAMGSLARSPQEVCEEAARECDVFILLLGPRYGWVIPELGISVVEREYEIARQTDPRKILVYVGHADEREERQEELVRRVTDYTSGYFRARPFDTPADLSRLIREDIANWIAAQVTRAGGKATDLLALPSAPAALRSSLWQILGVLLVVAGLDVSGRTGLLKAPYRLETRPFLEALLQQWERLPRDTGQFVATVAGSLVLGCGMTLLALAFAIMFRRSELVMKQLSILATFGAAYCFYFAAPYLTVTNRIPVDQLFGACTAAALFLGVASTNSDRGIRKPFARRVWDAARVVVLSREMPWIYLVMTLAIVVWNAVNWSELQLLITFRGAQGNGDTPRGIVTGLVIAVVAVVGFTVIRVVQALYGSAYIKRVIARHSGI